MMDTLERFHIFREAQIENQINDRLTVRPNIIFDVIMRNNPQRETPYAKQQLIAQATNNSKVRSTRSSPTEGHKSTNSETCAQGDNSTPLHYPVDNTHITSKHLSSSTNVTQ
jgi:hypothetical protein